MGTDSFVFKFIDVDIMNKINQGTSDEYMDRRNFDPSHERYDDSKKIPFGFSKERDRF